LARDGLLLRTDSVRRFILTGGEFVTEVRDAAAAGSTDSRPGWGIVRMRFAPSRRGSFNALLIYAAGMTLVTGLVLSNGAGEGMSPSLLSVGGWLLIAAVVVVLAFLWGLVGLYGIE